MNTNTTSQILLQAFNCFGIMTETKDSDREYLIGIEFKSQFDKNGPFAMAKELGVLVNNSAEEFSIAWMSYFNQTFYPAY